MNSHYASLFLQANSFLFFKNNIIEKNIYKVKNRIVLTLVWLNEQRVKTGKNERREKLGHILAVTLDNHFRTGPRKKIVGGDFAANRDSDALGYAD